jgi:hypothetical protein
VRISANSSATSVIGFWRPVSTLASLIGVASGTEEANNGKEAVFKDLSFVPQAQ